MSQKLHAHMVAILIDATCDVFETMVFQPLGVRTPIDGASTEPHASVVGTVAFTGAQCGLVALHTTVETARTVAGAMLGIPSAHVNGEMRDAIGEITNMIAGSFRTRMAADGPGWAISVPTVTTGTDFQTTCLSNVRRTLCPFTLSDGGEIYVELVLTASSADAS